MSKSQNISQTKYRPVLTENQISHVIQLCRTNPSNASRSILSTLSLFEYKIKYGAITPAYTIDSESDPDLNSDILSKSSPPSLGYSKQDKLSIYEKWKLLDFDESLNSTEFKILQEYLYESDLMTTEEEQDYENSLLTFLSPLLTHEPD